MVAMDALTQRLESARPVIEKILSLSGTVGLSYGLLHEGKVVHTESFGFRDHDKNLPVNEETIFPLCSLTKAMVASGVGILVDDGKLSRDPKIRELLPGFRTQSGELHQSASILDYLSMRTGMQPYNTWLQSQNNIIFPPGDSLKIINSFKQVQPLHHGLSVRQLGLRDRQPSLPEHRRNQLGLLSLEQHLQALGSGKEPLRTLPLWTRAM